MKGYKSGPKHHEKFYIPQKKGETISKYKKYFKTQLRKWTLFY